MTIRQAQRIANILLLASVVVRLIWPPAGKSAGYAFLLIGSARLALMIPDIRRGAEPWQRVLVPGIVVLQVAVVLAGLASRSLVAGVTAALEIALLGGAAWFTIRRYGRAADGCYPEEALAESLSFFVPPAVARAMAGEMATLGYAVYGLAHGFHLPARAGFPYADNSIMPFITLAVLIESPPEILLAHKLFQIRSALVSVILIGVHVWAVFWIYGIYVSMRMRPHRATSDELVLNRGILGTVRFSPCVINSMQLVKEGEKPAAGLIFTVKGPPQVLIELREPVRARRFLRGMSPPTTTILASVDRPAEFREALLASRAARVV